MPEDLKSTVRSSLDACKGAWNHVAFESGVSHSWLVKFMNNHIPKPGYDTLMKLQSHFGKPRSKAVKDSLAKLDKKVPAKKVPVKKAAKTAARKAPVKTAAKKAAKRPALKKR